MRQSGTSSIVDVRPKLRPAAAVAGADTLSQSTAGGFAALRVDLHSIEDRLVALRDRLEALVHTDELAQLEAAEAHVAAAQAAVARGAIPQPTVLHPQYGVRAVPETSAPVEPRQQPSVPAAHGNVAPARSASSPALSAMSLLRSNRRQHVTLPRPLPWNSQTHVNGAPVNGAPVNRAPLNSAPVQGAPVIGPTANGTPVNGAHINGSSQYSPKVIFPNGAPAFPNGAPLITNSGQVVTNGGQVITNRSPAPAAPAANGQHVAGIAAPAPEVAAVPQPGTTKLPTLAEVRPAGRSEPTWMGTALRRLAPADREAAGRAIIGLLPIQGDVIPDDVAYDLVISDGAYAVTVTEEEVAIQRIPIPRPLASIDGRIQMTLEGLGALPTSKRVRALLRSGSVRVAGRHGKRALAALHQVAIAPVGLARACEAGVVLPEDVLMSLVAAAIPPEWTIGHRFTICVETGRGTVEPQARLFLRVNDGGNVAVNEGLPLDIPTATIRCTPEALAWILLGGAPEDATLAGDKAPIMLLQGWISRLESARA